MRCSFCYIKGDLGGGSYNQRINDDVVSYSLVQNNDKTYYKVDIANDNSINTFVNVIQYCPECGRKL